MRQPFILADFLPYLLNRAGSSLAKSFVYEAARYDVPLSVWRVLAALWQHGDCRLRELAEVTSIDVSTLSRLVTNMETKQLVRRHRSGTDRRALKLSLTEKGRQLTEQIIPIARRHEQVAIRRLTDSEVRRLKRLLAKIYANMEPMRLEQAAARRTIAAE